jgi:hypothetical protein
MTRTIPFMPILRPSLLKRFVSVCALATLLAVGLPAIASAHILKVDGNIGAVLHIPPNDHPFTNTPTEFTLTFVDDDSQRFNLAGCNCTVSFIQNGKTIASQPLGVSDIDFSDNHHTFTKPGVYTFHVTGSPQHAGEFQSFSLYYEERIYPQSITHKIPLVIWIGLGVVIGIILLGAFIANDRSGKKQT